MSSIPCSRCFADSFALSLLDRRPLCGACFQRELGVRSLDVLLVEDNPSFAYMVERHFVRAGHRVRTSSSSEHALELIAEKVPDVLVADHHLATPFDGSALLSWAATEHPAVKRILYSSRSSMQQSPAWLALEKSPSPNDLLVAVAA